MKDFVLVAAVTCAGFLTAYFLPAWVVSVILFGVGVFILIAFATIVGELMDPHGKDTRRINYLTLAWLGIFFFSCLHTFVAPDFLTAGKLPDDIILWAPASILWVCACLTVFCIDGMLDNAKEKNSPTW